MRTFLSRHKGFVAASISTGVVLGGLWILYRILGHAIIEEAYHERSHPLFNGMFRRPVRPPVERYFSSVDDRIAAVTSFSLAAWALFAWVYFWVKLKLRWPLGIAGLLVFWIGVETFCAPHLIRPLRLENFFYVRDPDHWPKAKDIYPGEGAGYNSDLVRSPWQPEDFTPESFNVLFLGDSFTFGAKLRAEEAFPHLVGTALRAEFPERDVRFANFGWDSSSPLLSLRRMRHLGAKYHPDLVALFVDMTDFQDDIKWGNMLEKRGLYAWFDRLPLTLRLFKLAMPGAFWKLYWRTNDNMPRRRFFVTEQPLEESRPYLEPIKSSILALDEECRALGARFMLFILPRHYQYDPRECPNNWEKDEYELQGPHHLAPFQYFGELRGEVEFPIRSPLQAFIETEVFPTCFDYDPHWTPAGAQVAAESILQDMRAYAFE